MASRVEWRQTVQTRGIVDLPACSMIGFRREDKISGCCGASLTAYRVRNHGVGTLARHGRAQGLTWAPQRNPASLVIAGGRSLGRAQRRRARASVRLADGYTGRSCSPPPVLTLWGGTRELYASSTGSPGGRPPGRAERNTARIICKSCLHESRPQLTNACAGHSSSSAGEPLQTGVTLKADDQLSFRKQAI